jgi:hypothetical protein
LETLNLNEVNSSGENADVTSDEESDLGSKPVVAAKGRKKKSSGKGKKTKRGRKGKKKQQDIPAEESSLDIVPLESCRVHEDGSVTDFFMAIYGFIKEWGGFRSYLQKLWAKVAYNGLNSVVAAVLSNIAIAMVKKTESAIFVDFPGHDMIPTKLQ